MTVILVGRSCPNWWEVAVILVGGGGGLFCYYQLSLAIFSSEGSRIVECSFLLLSLDYFSFSSHFFFSGGCINVNEEVMIDVPNMLEL